ncbi:peptide deformylase [Marinicella sp. W31]|uniref:peptide deformylase n=1 Tax=Marinicella sp. W31 TaxID=3023713 RepID=UPI003756FD68
MRIRQMGDPVLREISTAVNKDDLNSTEVQTAIQDMQTALQGIRAISPANGTAISAPQVGINKRMVMLRSGDDFHVLINPRIIEASTEMFEFVEECFSLYYLRGVVQRHQSVTVAFENTTGQTQTEGFEGDKAGIVQHEIDHLDGVLFVDKVIDTLHISTVDYHYRDRPQRLQEVKEMYAYMAGITN